MRRPELKTVRDPLIFLAGLAGAMHEIFLTSTDRPYVLAFVATLLGLPFFIRLDESRRAPKGGE